MFILLSGTVYNDKACLHTHTQFHKTNRIDKLKFGGCLSLIFIDNFSASPATEPGKKHQLSSED